jgi:hypothetical protein
MDEINVEDILFNESTLKEENDIIEGKDKNFFVRKSIFDILESIQNKPYLFDMVFCFKTEGEKTNL